MGISFDKEFQFNIFNQEKKLIGSLDMLSERGTCYQQQILWKLKLDNLFFS